MFRILHSVHTCTLPVGSRGTWTSSVHTLPYHSSAVILASGLCYTLHPSQRHPGCSHTPPLCDAGQHHTVPNTVGQRWVTFNFLCVCGKYKIIYRNKNIFLQKDVCLLTGLHSDRTSHWLQIFSWHVDLVTGLSDEAHSSVAAVTEVSVPLVWRRMTWRQMTWRCWKPGPHLLLHFDHSPRSQLLSNHKE